ncbi:DNA polymerase delta subunit 3-like [Esox lucius]|uniref:DNA polymerase delta subunit 3-like n=1 Tax=Esox lucius TaxID=8010 RepID=UPI001477135F|nr:DNA polymerase delta subunit 3-like [Esox lucius]
MVSLEGITGGGDTDDIHDDGTAGPSALEASPPQPIQEPEPILAPEPKQVQAGEAESRPPASRAPRPRVLTDEVLERQTETSVCTRCCA